MTAQENPCWEQLPGWEPNEGEQNDDIEDYGVIEGCHYCPSTIVFRPDPFGGKPCCRGCFEQLVGGDEDGTT